MRDFDVYDADYYLFGKQTGKSCYENYRYLPDLSLPMCRRIAEYLCIHEDDTIMDFGAARGYVVRAFRELGYRAFGVDASQWAIDNCDPSVKEYVHCSTIVTREVDWIVAKDVLEHIPDPDLAGTIDNLYRHARKGIFVVVPLSPANGAPYVVPEYEQDITHCQRKTLGGWMMAMNRTGWCVGACHRVRGVKDNYYREGYEQANGFLVARPDFDMHR